VDIQAWQSFIEHLAAICQQSGVLSWPAALQKVLALFAAVCHTQEAAMLVLNEAASPLICLALPQNTPVLPGELRAHEDLWQTILATLEGFSVWHPERQTPVWVQPVPPQPTGPRAALIFLADPLAPPAALLAQGAALITPLVQTAQLRMMEQHHELIGANIALAQTLDPNQVLDQTLEHLKRIIPHDAGCLLLLSGDVLEAARWRGYEYFDAESVIATLRVPLHNPHIRSMLNSHDARLVADTAEDPSWVVFPGLEWIRANVMAPIIAQENVIGFIALDSATPRAFAACDARWLKMYADSVAIAIQNARLYQNAHKQSEETALLYDELKQRQIYVENLNTVISAVNSAVSLDEVLQIGLEKAIQIGGMARGVICLLATNDMELSLRVQQGFAPGELDAGQICRLGQGITGQIKSADAVAERALAAPHEHISLPLMVENQLVGVMNLDAPREQTIPLAAQQLLSAIADQLTLAVQRSLLAAQTREQLQTVHNLYEISAAFLSQSNIAGITFILVRTLCHAVEGALSTAFYQLSGDQWTRERVYISRRAPALVKQRWAEGPAWEAEKEFLEACRQERMLVLASHARGRTPPTWPEIEALGARQMLYFPISLPNHNLFYVLNLMLAHDHPLAAHESTLTWAIVQQASAALVRVRLYEQSQKSESRLRAILESSRDGIFLVGHNLTIHYVNGQALQLLHLPGDTTMWEGQPLANVIAATRVEAPTFAGWLIHNTAGEGRHAARIEDMEFETAHGLLLKLQQTPIHSNHDPNPGALLLLRDITEQRALERMRDDLLNMLVHDMRNPLAVVQNALQMLADPVLQEMSAEIIEMALSNTTKLMDLVNVILEISRGEVGRLNLSFEAVYLPDYLYEMARELMLEIPTLDFQIVLPDNVPLLWIDINMIVRVLENLLSNARKFIPQEHGIIRVTGAYDVDWLTLEIYNNGPPIPPNVYKQLFQKFMAGDYEKRGYGLGLASCKMAIEAHGGQIWALNQPEGGVSFYFTLPVFHVPDFPDEDV